MSEKTGASRTLPGACADPACPVLHADPANPVHPPFYEPGGPMWNNPQRRGAVVTDASCTLPTYLSWGQDGDEGAPWTERVECDGPRGCGWSRDLSHDPAPSAGGINSDEFAALDAEHRTFPRSEEQS